MDLIEAMRRESGEDPALRDLVRKFDHQATEPDLDRVSAQVAYMLTTGHTVWGIEAEVPRVSLDVLTDGAERLLEHHRAFVVKVEGTNSVLNGRNVAAIDIICIDEPS